MSANKIDETPAISFLPDRAVSLMANLGRDSIILNRDDIQMFLMGIALLSLRGLGKVVKVKNTVSNIGGDKIMKRSKELVDLMNAVAEKLTEAVGDYDDAIRLHKHATKTLKSVSKEARELNNICRESLGRPKI